MSGSKLFPQLSWPVARSLAEDVKNERVADLRGRIDNDGIELDKVTYSAVGGNRVETGELSELRRQLCAVISDLGFPTEASTRDTRRKFDVVVSAFLHGRMNISPNQASLPGVWQAMTCLVAPDLVLWRFSGTGEDGTSIARFRGGVRNTFERLWWRGEILGSVSGLEPYEMIARLNEDELVQIMERPNLRANRRLVRFVAAEFLSRLSGIEVAREALMRDVQKRIFRLFPFVAFESLDDDMLSTLISDVFTQSLNALRDTNEQIQQTG